MSVLIKGLEMPKNCNQCLINCEHSQLYIGIKDKRADECPLIEIPPHGRLIDADDAFIDADERGFDFWCCDADIDSAQNFIREQPTVIEAEE